MNLMSDQMTLWVINVLIHSTVLTASLLLVATMFRRRAAMRYWVLCCGLLLVLGSPVISAAIQSRGGSWIALAAPSESPSMPASVKPQAVKQVETNFAALAESRSTEQAPEIDLTRQPKDESALEADAPAAAALPPIAPQPAPSEVTETRSLMQCLSAIVAFVSLVWLIGAALLLLRMSIGWFRLSRILKRATPIEDAGFQAAFARACSAVGCGDHRAPKLVASDEISGPLAAGIGCSYVVLPKHLLAKADPGGLADVLVHEVAHVVRRDQIVVLVQNLASAIYWPHPLVRKLNQELAKAREEVCDNFVLATTDAPIYSRTLLSLAQLVQRRETIPGSVGFFASRWKLENRVAGLLDEARDRATFLSRRGLAFVSAATLTLIAAISFGTITIAQNTSQISTSEVDAGSIAITISGSVGAQDGGGIAGAKVWLAVASHQYPDEANRINRDGLLRELGIADDRGRFEFELDVATTQQIREQLHSSRAQVVATAPGHGLDWMPLDVFENNAAPSEKRDLLRSQIDKSLGDGRFASRTLKLRPESRPLRGRLVDLEGLPLSNVTVLAESLEQPDIPQLLIALETSWKQALNEALSATRFGVGGLARSELQRLVPPVMTDENGEFELRGIGDDQLVTLVFDADRVESGPLYVLGRDMKTVSLPHVEWQPDGAKDVFAGRDFTYAVGPSVPVEGVVTDYDTGEPVADVLVSVERLFQRESEGQLRLDTRHMRAVTDQQGRFRITGMPPGEGHIIEAAPPVSEPYLMVTQEVSTSLQHGDAKSIKMQMKRGIWIEGRVTDQQSGEPRLGTVDYMPLKSNPHALIKLGTIFGYLHERYQTDSDGLYRTVGLPGPGVLLVKLQDPGYPLASGAETVDGYDSTSGKISTTFFPLPVTEWHLVKQIDPAADAVSFDCDLKLDTGTSIAGRVVGPDGKRISDFFILGQTEKELYWGPRKSDSTRITTDRIAVNGYDGKGPRQLFVKNPAETLVGQYRLEGAAPEEIVVKLEPSVRVTGRLIDRETELPAPRFFVACEKSSLFNEEHPTTKFNIDWCHSDDEGRFEIKGMIAGLAYEMYALNEGNARDYNFTIDLTDAKPGEAIDIGDVSSPERDKPPAGATPKSGENTAVESSAGPSDVSVVTDTQDERTVTGVVLKPDGSPAVDATLRATAPVWADMRTILGDDYQTPASEVVADEEGRFEISYITKPHGPLPVEGTTWEDYWKKTPVAASLPGYGGQQAMLGDSGELQIKLVREEPIRGRVIDLEGQPRKGVTVEAIDILAAKKENLDGWLKSVANYEPVWVAASKHLNKQFLLQSLGISKNYMTDEVASTLKQPIW